MLSWAYWLENKQQQQHKKKKTETYIVNATLLLIRKLIFNFAMNRHAWLTDIPLI